VILLETLSVKEMLANADPEIRKMEPWRERAYHKKIPFFIHPKAKIQSVVV